MPVQCSNAKYKHVQCICTMQLPNLKNEEKQIKPTKLTKEKSAIKRGNKPQAPLASEQRCPAQVVL